MKTYMAKKGEFNRKWVSVDGTDKVLGRLAMRCAMALMGKHRPTFTPHVETGDFIVVTNASKIRLTGRKLDQKLYKTYSGYPSGLKETRARVVMARKPQEALRLAVRRMLPKGSLGNSMLGRLKIYAGSDHPHAAQMPEVSQFLIGDKRG